MSSYPDPALHGAVYPSEEEIDPAGADVEPASGPAEADAGQPDPRPSPEPSPQVDTAARSIVSRHQDGSVEVVTDPQTDP